MGKPHFETFPGNDGKHYWRLQAANGEIIAISEGYDSEQGADRGIDAVKRGVLEALGINTRSRIQLGETQVVERTDPERDGELKVTTPGGLRTFLEHDAELLDELPV